MRIGNTFTNMMTSSSYGAYSSRPTLHSPSPSSQQPPRSPWHSPVPYLFGGLAAMLGLIAFALLILACSYWKLSGYLEGENGGGEDQGGNNEVEIVKVENDNRIFEEKFLVIMAGEVKPTHLATPSTSRTSSFGSEQQSEKTAETKAEEEGGPGS
uniref:Uncharacterized protein n=1 Tax=Kalanchoe fedtschenkoi TaxID=63787 RepID=A0A7N0TY83_KALFE